MKSAFPLLLVLALCLGSVSCNEIKATQAQRDEARAKWDALAAENNELETNLAALKAAVPPTIGTGLAALKVAEKLEQDLVTLSQQLDKAVKSYEETISAHQALEKEVAVLRQAKKS